MIPWLMNTEETPRDRYNTLNKIHMVPVPPYHNKISKRFGFDIFITAYGQTEVGSGMLGYIDETGDQEGTPKELWKGHSKEELWEIARKYDYPIVDGSQEIKKGFMGKPSALLEATILDENDEELGPGQYGQLAFRGKFPYLVLDGYLNKPEATLSTFKNFWWHTGDACYRDEDGIFYYVDRMGAFIRTRGENISSFQIEDIINSHPKVEVSAAFPIPAEEGEEDDIVVYIVLKQKEDLEEEQLRPWIESEMPRFMWPKHIRFLDDLPQTPTNRVEKYKLKDKILSELGKNRED